MFWARDGYDPVLAAVFAEADRRHDGEEYGYHFTVARMRDRLQLQGFTVSHAYSQIDTAIEEWRKKAKPDDPVPSNTDDLLATYHKILDVPEDDDDFESSSWDAYSEPRELHEVLFYVDIRAVLRLLLDMLPDHTEIVLDLSELTGCCVELDPMERLAERARNDQRATLVADTPSSS